LIDAFHRARIDAPNETLVLDIKPYSPARKIEKFELPDWYKNIIAYALSKIGTHVEQSI
jgi:tRNA (Thr-GGU) A37 N-methylase